jgi:hypothetical protein
VQLLPRHPRHDLMRLRGEVMRKMAVGASFMCDLVRLQHARVPPACSHVALYRFARPSALHSFAVESNSLGLSNPSPASPVCACRRSKMVSESRSLSKYIRNGSSVCNNTGSRSGLEATMRSNRRCQIWSSFWPPAFVSAACRLRESGSS